MFVKPTKDNMELCKFYRFSILFQDSINRITNTIMLLSRKGTPQKFIVDHMPEILSHIENDESIKLALEGIEDIDDDEMESKEEREERVKEELSSSKQLWKKKMKGNGKKRNKFSGKTYVICMILIAYFLLRTKNVLYLAESQFHLIMGEALKHTGYVTNKSMMTDDYFRILSKLFMEDHFTKVDDAFVRKQTMQDGIIFSMSTPFILHNCVIPSFGYTKEAFLTPSMVLARGELSLEEYKKDKEKAKRIESISVIRSDYLPSSMNETGEKDAQNNKKNKNKEEEKNNTETETMNPLNLDGFDEIREEVEQEEKLQAKEQREEQAHIVDIEVDDQSETKDKNDTSDSDKVYEEYSHYFVHPSDLHDYKNDAINATGNILCLGIAFGIFIYHASMNGMVKSVTVVEENESVIHMFEQVILPKIKGHARRKIKLIHDDPMRFLNKKGKMEKGNFDLIYSSSSNPKERNIRHMIRFFLKAKKYAKEDCAVGFHGQGFSLAYYVRPILAYAFIEMLDREDFFHDKEDEEYQKTIYQPMLRERKRILKSTIDLSKKDFLDIVSFFQSELQDLTLKNKDEISSLFGYYNLEELFLRYIDYRTGKKAS